MQALDELKKYLNEEECSEIDRIKQELVKVIKPYMEDKQKELINKRRREQFKRK